MPGRIIQGTENPKHSEKLNHVNKRKSKNELNNRGGGGGEYKLGMYFRKSLSDLKECYRKR